MARFPDNCWEWLKRIASCGGGINAYYNDCARSCTGGPAGRRASAPRPTKRTVPAVGNFAS